MAEVAIFIKMREAIISHNGGISVNREIVQTETSANGKYASRKPISENSHIWQTGFFPQPLETEVFQVILKAYSAKKVQ